MTTTWSGLRLDALDTLFFRDGRPFAPATRAEGGLPLPQTLAGALRTALLVQQGIRLDELAGSRKQGLPIRAALEALGAPAWVLNTRFRGPWLAEVRDNRVEPLLPVPAILARRVPRGETRGVWSRSWPLPPGSVPGWSHPDAWPLWRASEPDAKHPNGFLTLEGTRKFLEGGLPADEDWREPHRLYAHDARTGIAVDPDTLTAADGMLYGLRLLSLCAPVCLHAEVLPGEGAPSLSEALPELLPLGGEGRHVRSRVLSSVVKWPSAPAGKGSLWLLATPAPLGDSRKPFAGVRAAASLSPIAFSGWDVARGGPHPTRFAVPAGSVYFVEEDFAPAGDSLCPETEDVAQGWGFALRGIWNHD
jgi:CRISPR-associated protein Cmr3